MSRQILNIFQEHLVEAEPCVQLTVRVLFPCSPPVSFPGPWRGLWVATYLSSTWPTPHPEKTTPWDRSQSSPPMGGWGLLCPLLSACLLLPFFPSSLLSGL